MSARCAWQPFSGADKVRNLHVCLDARLTPGEAGGVQQIVMGLASGLGAIGTEDDRYSFLVNEVPCPWLQPYLGASVSLLDSSSGMSGNARRRLRRVAAVRRAASRVRQRLPANRQPPVSSGVVEASGAQLIHFTTQTAFLTSVPSIYQPHDLQHRFLPEYFSDAERRRRDFLYAEYCDRAELVVVMTRKGRHDLVECFGLPEEKIAVVPWAPLVPSNSFRGEEAREDFILYPAQTWPHKNHAVLLRALRLLHVEFGLRVPLVCTGFRSSHYKQLRRLALETGVDEQVDFRGFVSRSELFDLYRRARILVFPSRFEGWGLPITDAMSTGLPIAASDLPELREQADGAAEWFDAEDASDVAAKVAHLWTSEDRREQLRVAGSERVRQYSWEKTAETLRAHYRQVTGQPITIRDRQLITNSRA